MPRITTLERGWTVRLWEGDCPARMCAQHFRIEAAPWQPKIDVLRTFKYVRPQGPHVHGSFSVNEYEERGGE